MTIPGVPEQFQPGKQGYLVQITDEQLEFQAFRVLSPEEQREAREAQRAEAAAKMVRLQVRLATAHQALQPIIRHHVPDAHGFLDGYWTCKGCDSGSYAEDSPEWPCSTIELILEGVPKCDCHNDPYNCSQGQALAGAIHDRKTAQGDGQECTDCQTQQS